MINKLFLSTILLVLSTSVQVNAQYALDQPKSLAEAKTVKVYFAPGIQSYSDLYNKVTLELRKTGLKIVEEDQDIILNVSVQSSANTITQDIDVRLDVEQFVIMPRTDEKIQLVTWYYEVQERVDNGDWNYDRLESEIMNGINSFLSDYLTANDR